METSLMVHDYPEQPENNENVYKFKCYCEVEIVVCAEDLESAKEHCNFQDCESYDIKSIEEIEDYEIED